MKIARPSVVQRRPPGALSPVDLAVVKRDVFLYGEPGSGKTWTFGPLIAEFDLKILVIHCGIGGHGMLSVRDYLASRGCPEKYGANVRVLEPETFAWVRWLADSWDNLVSPFPTEDAEFFNNLDLLVVEELNGLQYMWTREYLGEADEPDEKERFAFYGGLKSATERIFQSFIRLRPSGRPISHWFTTHENPNKTIEAGGETREGRLAPDITGRAVNLMSEAVDFLIRTAKVPRNPNRPEDGIVYAYQYGTSDMDKVRGNYPASGPADPVKLWRKMGGEPIDLSWPDGKNPFNRGLVKPKTSTK